ncbi:MAG: ferredoxin [Planctomycetes bacterium]|nr:ferredoxin [Planctomycetota bacterium]
MAEHSPEVRALEAVADLMCLAARTAPKARGLDNLHIAIVRGGEKARVTAKMRDVAAADPKAGFFARDAAGCDAAPLVVLIGTRVAPLGIPSCGFCGHDNCDACAKAGGRCAYNAGDLGIALGSAAAVAAAHHADNRIMFSFGKAAIQAGLLPPDIQIAFGIPLSATGKSPFFDRK